ncbi:MAG: Na-translocating system protein MpsC family protein, partial [Cyanobacteria bacterium J06555_3]
INQNLLGIGDEGKSELAQKVRSNLDDAIQPELKELIEKIAEVGVIEILSDATLETGRTGIIAVLSQTPQVRNPENIPKVKH